MGDRTWIEEQKDNRMFRGSGTGSDAHKMLEISPTNRILSAIQGKKFPSARYLNQLLGITAIDDLVDLLERAQLVVDEKSRVEFMKVAIEQWQGKIAAGNRFKLENIV